MSLSKKNILYFILYYAPKYNFLILQNIMLRRHRPIDK